MTRAARVCGVRGLGAAVAAVLCCALARPARAHEAPAEAPDFAPGECILIVDKAEQPLLHIDYSLAYDDVELGFGDIPLPDSKTHQFFAFRGSLIPRGFGYELYAFDPAIEQGSELPLWITIDDIKRAAQASGTVDGTAFTGENLPPGAVLQGNAALDGRWLRISADDARVPITIEQSKSGADWDLAEVEPGLYSVAAYVFSPPYNGWAARHGLVKVTGEGGQDAPAGVVEPVHSFLYTGQGRRVSACIDAPPGSRVRGAFRVEERMEEGWTDWLPERELDGSSLDLCFHYPRPDLAGSLRLRFELEAPDGTVTAVYSPDTITALRGESECVASDTLCCDPPAATIDAGSGGEAADAGASAAAGGGAGTAGRPGAEAGPAGGGDEDDGDGGGCATTGAPARPLRSLVPFAAVLLWFARRRRS